MGKIIVIFIILVYQSIVAYRYCKTWVAYVIIRDKTSLALSGHHSFHHMPECMAEPGCPCGLSPSNKSGSPVGIMIPKPTSPPLLI